MIIYYSNEHRPFMTLFYSGTNESLNVKLLSPMLLVAEKEEAKAVLTLFLKKQGLSNANATKIINRSDPFIDHLISKLHSKHKTWYLSGWAAAN